MTYVPKEQVPVDAEIFTGPKGGTYFYRDGKRIYIFKDKKKGQRHTFNPRKGKFTEWLDNQLTQC